MSPARPPTASWRSVDWPEIGPDDDLVALTAGIDGLRDGDIVLVTSKVVSKAEGCLVHEERAAVVARESRRIVARRGATVIAETRHGLVMAAAGVDASNTPPGTALTLPVDPDRSARRLREGVHAETGLNVAVVVTDTAGRAWRTGQTDLAVGCAGLLPLVDLAGTSDTHGNVLQVTAPAVADELASAAELVKGKTSGRPVAVVTGLGRLVLPPGDHGPGAVALVRPSAEDLFALGTREAAVAAAVRSDAVALDHFPAWSPADADPFEGLHHGLLDETTAGAGLRAMVTRDDCPTRPGQARTWTLRIDVPEDAGSPAMVMVGRLVERAHTLAAAARLAPHDHDAPAAEPDRQPFTLLCWQDR